MSLAFNKIEQNPFITEERLMYSFKNLYIFFSKQISDIKDLYSFWNMSSSTFLSYLCQVIISFHKTAIMHPSIYALSLIFMSEGLLNHNNFSNNISFYVKNILNYYTKSSLKKNFITSFMFSEPVEIVSQNNFHIKHLFCNGHIPCSIQCKIQEIEKIDKYFLEVLNYIYMIRNSFVHRGLICDFVKPTKKKKYHARIYDRFAVRNGNKFIYFSSILQLNQFENVIKTALWKHLNRNI